MIILFGPNGKYQNSKKKFIKIKRLYFERNIFYKSTNEQPILSLEETKYWFSDDSIDGRLIIFDISLGSSYILHNKFDQQMSKFDEKNDQ